MSISPAGRRGKPAARIQPRSKVRLQARDAVLIIDVLNDLDFGGGHRLLPFAERLVQPVLTVRRRARQKNIPVIYVNDNFGQWLGDMDSVLQYCMRKGALGREVSSKLRPTKKDYRILKPKHSAFYETSLALLLEHLKIKRLIITGMATNMCVLHSANDAHMRGFKLVVVTDACAAETNHDHDSALRQLAYYYRAILCRADQLE